MIDRAEIARALAKCLAYKQAGKQALAEEWAAEVVRQLECDGVLRLTGAKTRYAQAHKEVDGHCYADTLKEQAEEARQMRTVSE